jgi:hypothetical protein
VVKRTGRIDMGGHDMTRKWIKYPSVPLETALGPVVAAFTDGGHVAVGTDGAHISDDNPALVFRGRDYLANVHLYAEPGDGREPWSPRRSDRSIVKKRRPYVDAAPTHAKAIEEAIISAVRAYVAANPDVLRMAEAAQANNELVNLEEKRAEAVAALADIDASIATQSARLRAAQALSTERRKIGQRAARLPEVPDDFPVRPLGPNDAAQDRRTDGACGRSWDDAVATSWTPAPAGRCPFEHFHADES